MSDHIDDDDGLNIYHHSVIDTIEEANKISNSRNVSDSRNVGNCWNSSESNIHQQQHECQQQQTKPATPGQWTPMTMTEVFPYRTEDSKSIIAFSVTGLKILATEYR